MAFSKLDPGIVRSSIWFEPPATRCLWFTFLAIKDENGFVASSRQGLRATANITEDEFEVAIKCLESPDNDSRSEEFKGRRVQKIEGGWIVLNHEKYRMNDELQREQTRVRVQRCREKQRLTEDVTLSNVTETLPSGSGSVSVSSSVVLKEGCGGKEKTWRNDFETYKAEEQKAFDVIFNFPEWIRDRQQYHPNLDIKKTIQKAHVDFWSTEAGWMNKKSKRSVKIIDWSATYRNALASRVNQCYIPRDQVGIVDDTAEAEAYHAERRRIRELKNKPPEEEE